MKPDIPFFDQNINLCKLARARTHNVFVKEFFNGLLRNIKFEIKCPLQKGVYQRDPVNFFNLSAASTSDKRLSIPSFISYDKELMIKMTFSTKVDGRQDQIAVIEDTNKIADITY